MNNVSPNIRTWLIYLQFILRGNFSNNKETAAQLVSHLGLSDKEAAAVVTYREKHGNFKSIDDLKKVPSIDTKKIDEKKDDLSFS